MSIQESASESPFGCSPLQTSSVGTLSPIDVYDLMGCGTRQSTERRWIILRALHELAPVPKTDFVTHVSALENDVPDEAVTTKQRNRINAALTQTHFPPFEEAGIIRLDELTGGTQVSLGENAAALFAFVGFERRLSVVERLLKKLR